ncbi:MAG TPA: phosphatidylserine decarboxylase family protein [bacterium]|nr:phosphatidylserine decarboxylase family protein [bacterium]
MSNPWIWNLITGIVICTGLALKLNLGWKIGASGGMLIGLLGGGTVYLCSPLISNITLTGIVALSVVLQCFWIGAVILFRFYRDPNRTTPREPDIIVSPADGIVRYVVRIGKGQIPIATKKKDKHILEELVHTPVSQKDGWLIGIEMRILDVHVNRAPLSGRVTMVKYIPGAFLSLRRTESVFLNERVTTIIQHKEWQVAVVQIASRLVRRIRSYVRAGESVDRGQRTGRIVFGSQVDIVIPVFPHLTLTVEKGQKVRAGETILAQFSLSGDS